MAASPVKEVTEQQISKVLKAMPALPSNMNESEKDDKQAKREMLESIITDLMLDSDHILATHNALQKRKEAKAKQHKEDGKLLPEDMERVSKIPEGTLVDTLSTLGDLSSDDIILCKEFDSASDTQLTTFATGMLPSFRLSSAFRVPGILTIGFQARHNALNKRLEHFKANGGIVGGSRLNWKKGVYVPKYDPKSGTLLEIKHISSHVAKAPAWCSQINSKWEIAANWSDWDAQFELPNSPSPPVPCRHLSIADKQGPFTLDLLRKNEEQDAFAKFIQTKHQELVNAAEAASAAARQAAGPAAAVNPSTTAKLEDLKKKKGKQLAQTAKGKAAKTLADRQAKRRALFRKDSNASNPGGSGGGAAGSAART